MRNKIEERIKNKTYNKRKVLVVFLCAAFVLFLSDRQLVYLMIFDAEYYQNMAEELHEREREIKAARGEIVRQKRSCSCDKQDGVYDFGYSQSDKRSVADGRHAQ